MTQAGDPDRPVLALLYLRYDCATNVLYAFVRVLGDGQFRADRADEAYLRIDGVGKLVSGETGDDGEAPDFAWTGRNGNDATGWEASGTVAPGRGTIRAHVLLAHDDEDGYLKLDTVPRYADLVLECDPAPTGTPETSPTPTPSPTATPTPTPSPTATPTPSPTPSPTPAPTPSPTPSPTPEPSESDDPTENADPGDDQPIDTEDGVIVVLPMLAASAAWATKPDRLRRRMRAR